jgi:hypothetical protein
MEGESQVSVGPLNRIMSLDEAYIVLGVEGGAKNDDSAIMLAYGELVHSMLYFTNTRWASSQNERMSSRKPSR